MPLPIFAATVRRSRVSVGASDPAPPGGSGTVAFVWDAVGGADNYVLYVATSSMGTDIHSSNVGNVVTHTVSDLASDTYYWRVTAYTGANPISTTTERTVTV